METSEVQSGTTGSGDSRDGLGRRRHARRLLVRAGISAVAIGSVGVVSAQEASAGGGGASPGLAVTAAALVLSALAIGAVYLFSWRDRPEQTFSPARPTGETVPNRHTEPMYESNVAARETGTVDHDAFDPVGTGTLIAMYFAVIALMWLFMYFVEFLGNGPTVVG